jgi:26S proteasome regulatory subunit N9
MSYVIISQSAFPFLDSLKYQFPNLQNLISEIQNDLNLRLWHQLSGHLIELSENPSLHEGEYLINLYDNVIKSIESVFNPMKIMLIIKNLLKNYSQNQEKGINFLDEVHKRMNFSGEELIFLDCLKTECLLGLNRQYEAEDLLIKVKLSLEKLFEVDHFIYAYFYFLYAKYSEIKGKYDDFYGFSIQFFAYCSDNQVSLQEKIRLSYKMAVACLIGERMYNFTELVEKDFFKVLIGSSYEWIYNIILSLNSGNVLQFQESIRNYHKEIQSEAVLFSKVSLLDMKIRISALLNLIFQKNKNEKAFSYQEISNFCNCDYNTVEIISMKALSLGLIRGYIDEIEKSLVVNWVQPKFLDKERILILAERIDGWISKSVVVLGKFEEESRMLVK